MENSALSFALEKLRFGFTGIGSLPFKGENAPFRAIGCVFEQCPGFPYWPQLPNFKKEEDMIFQFSKNLPGLKFNTEECKYYIDNASDVFFKELETLFIDYEKVTAADTLSENEEILDKYKITEPYSNTIDIFFDHIKNANNKPSFIKGTITGPFTFSAGFSDREGKSPYYNETLMEMIVKFLTLKALWQIKEFKNISKNSIPVIFMDEPSISQVGNCAFAIVKNDEVINMLKTISDNIKKFGALSGIHCCGKTDWDITIESNVNIINFDAYFYSQSIGAYAKKLKQFMLNGGFLSFGIVPTLDKEALKCLDKDKVYKKFAETIDCFTSKNIDKDLILNHCFITPGCGCGSLDDEMAKKAFILAKELSELLKERF